MASESSMGETGETTITAEELAERLADSETMVTIDETTHSVKDEGGDRIRKQVFRVRIIDSLDD